MMKFYAIFLLCVVIAGCDTAEFVPSAATNAKDEGNGFVSFDFEGNHYLQRNDGSPTLVPKPPR